MGSRVNHPSRTAFYPSLEKVSAVGIWCQFRCTTRIQDGSGLHETIWLVAWPAGMMVSFFVFYIYPFDMLYNCTSIYCRWTVRIEFHKHESFRHLLLVSISIFGCCFCFMILCLDMWHMSWKMDHLRFRRPHPWHSWASRWWDLPRDVKEKWLVSRRCGPSLVSVATNLFSTFLWETEAFNNLPSVFAIPDRVLAQQIYVPCVWLALFETRVLHEKHGELGMLPRVYQDISSILLHRGQSSIHHCALSHP